MRPLIDNARRPRCFGARRRNIWITLALFGSLFTINAIVSLRNTQRLTDNQQAAVRANALLNASEFTLSTLRDAETGQRGFLITGDPSYLQPYNSAKRNIEKSLNDLEHLTDDSVPQQVQVTELRQLVSSELSELAAAIRNRPVGVAAAPKLIATDEGKRLMDRCREVIGSISDGAKRQIDFRAIDSERNATQGRTAILIGLATGLLLVMGVTRALLYQHDIERKTETAMIESYQFATSILDALQCQIAILNESGLIIATNKAWKDFAAANGGNVDLQTGGQYLEVCDRATGPSAPEAGEVAAAIRSIIRGELSDFKLEYACHSPSEQRWFIEHITRFVGVGRVRLVVSHENITAIKVAQIDRENAFSALQESHDALYASEERYRAITDAMPQMVWSTLPNGAADYFNKGWTDYTGRTIEQELGDGWLEVVHPDDHERTFNCWRAAVTLNSEYNTEYRVRRGSDGAYRWHLARGVPIRDSNGSNIVRWYGTTTDVDDQKQVTEQLRIAKEAADAANSAKSEFLANMSHEIRTPMNGVLGMTDLLLDSDLSEEQRGSAELVKTSAESLMVIINDILDYSKIEARRLELDPVEFQLNSLLHEILKTMSLRAHHKGLELICDIAPDVPNYVIGDPGRLRQILINLLGNAIKFTETGEVTLQARLESENDQEIEIKFTIIDTGIGVPADKLRTIFAPFAQADGSMTRRYGGTGLGLSISLQLAELMGGTLSVSSKPGEGSEFYFNAKFCRTKPLAANRPAANADQLKGLRILVVDDNMTTRRILTGILTHWEVNPVAVASGAEALAEVARAAREGQCYQLVLVDAVMPEMDGFTFVDKLSEQPSFSVPAIMMLTSVDWNGDAARCRAIGIFANLVKPIDGAELYDSIVDCALKPSPVSYAPTMDVKVAPRQRLDTVKNEKGLRILLAEDNVVNQLVARGLLEKWGHTVVVVSDGRQAVEAVAKSRFDLVFMDVQMPEMDGLKATQQIRQMDAETGRHTHIVAMTADAHDNDRQRCLAVGMDAYLSKPIVRKDLIAVIDRRHQISSR